MWLNSNLQYVDISNVIDIDTSYASYVIAYSENGLVYVRIGLATGFSGVKTVAKITNSNYMPRAKILGYPSYPSNAEDNMKISSCGIDTDGNISAWLTSALTYVEDICFVYPKMIS